MSVPAMSVGSTTILPENENEKSAKTMSAGACCSLWISSYGAGTNGPALDGHEGNGLWWTIDKDRKKPDDCTFGMNCCHHQFWKIYDYSHHQFLEGLDSSIFSGGCYIIFKKNTWGYVMVRSCLATIHLQEPSPLIPQEFCLSRGWKVAFQTQTLGV